MAKPVSETTFCECGAMALEDCAAPTQAQIDAAATKWCGEKDRETFHEDILYFRHQWRYLPGLRAYVEREVANG